MKTVILAGGRGSRLAELTREIPKPMVTIGGEPMLKHIMGIYARQGFSDFIIAGGYRLEVIHDWLSTADLPWRVELVDTGLDTNTGGRVKRLAPYLTERFFLTYGDGLADIDLQALLRFHHSAPFHFTITQVRPPARFGRVETNDYGAVMRFTNEPLLGEWINGGFAVFEPLVLDEIRDDEMLETGLYMRKAGTFTMGGYKHRGFWQCMDTLREKELLEELWKGGAPWIG